MKITIVQGAFFPVPPLLGGAVEKMWYGLAKEFVNQGHEVSYISKSYQGFLDIESEGGINHTRVKGYKVPSSGVILKVLDLFYTLKAVRKIAANTDIIISNTFWLPILLSSKQKKKCMIDVARMPKGQMKFYTKNARLRANSTPVAKAIKDEIKKEYFDRVVMIPNTLPFSNNRVIDFSKKEKIILYTGRIHPEKGLDILIKSFAALEAKDWQLLIVGPYSTETGGGGESYLNELKALSANSNVRFLEPVFDIDKLNEIYLKAAVFVYPSIAEQGETFGVSPLEAMSWGCATIVSNLECFKDFLIHNKNGLCFDHRVEKRVEILNQYLKDLIENPKLINDLATAGLKVNETHSNEKLAAEFLNEFESMKLKYQ
ncbi:glycosyltransferase family 4 protein [Flavobacterium sp. YJ01]|uniref:glycosyltransferase family 4 protein n=1 Tax=unclassified Flavobacterium TaxID=196869 RepID=UPI0023E4039D|nr:glycosyltransferase family 4 protein [Flavobacterium sp. YJ01]WET02065.1 glycosyltransferase family 4 protein [Flavobacterium sp. YJ01]